MHPATLALALAAFALPAAAQAQFTTDSTVTFSLSWTESDSNGLPAGNGNGILDPGEHALLRLTVSFSNQNTIGHYTPFPPGSGSGTIRGFGSGFIDLHGASTAGTAQGSWNVNQALSLGTNPTWDLVGPVGWGTPVNGGADLQNLQMGQFPQTAAAIIDTDPIPDIWRGVWTPTSFAIRTVTFVSRFPDVGQGAPTSVLFKTSSGPVGATCPVFFGFVQIPIAPSPATSLLLVPLLLPPRRRRWRAHATPRWHNAPRNGVRTMTALTRPGLAALAMLFSRAAAQTPIVSVPDDPADHISNPVPRPTTAEPLAAAALFDYDASAPLRFTVQGGQTQDNLRLVDATFDGAPGSQVPCTFVLPANPTHAPAVLFLHCGHTGREEFIPEALALARRGIVCLLIDAPFARPEPTLPDPAIPGRDAALLVRTVMDCRRATDLLRARPDTDPTRIAFVGHGFGASIGTILSAVEPRIGSFALLAPEPSIADRFRDDPAFAPRREALGPQRAAAFIAEMRPLDGRPFLAAARPMTVLLQFASRDREIPSDQAQRLATAAPSSTTVKTYLCGHELNDPQALTDRDDWLASRFSLAASR